MPLSEPVSQFLGFHQELSLHNEVLTVMSSRRKMMPTTSSSPIHARLSLENLHTKKQISTAPSDPAAPPECPYGVQQDPDEGRQTEASPTIVEKTSSTLSLAKEPRAADLIYMGSLETCRVDLIMAFESSK